MTKALLLVLVSACTTETTTFSSPPPPPKGTFGKGNAIAFEYKNPKPSCSFGCAIMQGSEEPIGLDPMPDDGAQIESSDPAILTAQIGTRVLSENQPAKIGDIRVKGVAPGTVELRIKKASGEILERVDLRVDVPARIAFEGGTSVKIGETIVLRVSAFDASGARLESYTGWDFGGDAPAVGSVSTPCAPLDHCLYDSADALTVKGVATGTMNAKAAGGGITGTQAITVVP